jgi:hypothetical protein
MSNRAIAARLYVTERTVEAHVTQIFQNLRLPERFTTPRGTPRPLSIAQLEALPRART